MKSFDIFAIAALSRLDAESLRGSLFSDMNNIAEFAGTLSDVSLNDISYDVSQKPTVLREDRVKPSLPKEELLSCAPSENGDFIVVPRTVGETG